LHSAAQGAILLVGHPALGDVAGPHRDDREEAPVTDDQLESQPESSPEGLGKTALRRLRVRSELIAEARRLTAAHGIAGFTIDELCTTVGISRRTFFNHFASKDDVVVGIALDDEGDEPLEAYGATTRDPALPPFATTFDDLSAILVERIEHVGLTRARAAEFKAALDREPRLLGTVMRQGDEQQRRIAAAVASHEGVDAADPRVDVAVGLMTGLAQRSMAVFFTAGGDGALRFDAVLADQLRLARELMAAGVAAPADPPTPPLRTTDREALRSA
jgi:AcrR family transcriptional regulator